MSDILQIILGFAALAVLIFLIFLVIRSATALFFRIIFSRIFLALLVGGGIITYILFRFKILNKNTLISIREFFSKIDFTSTTAIIVYITLCVLATVFVLLRKREYLEDTYIKKPTDPKEEKRYNSCGSCIYYSDYKCKLRNDSRLADDEVCVSVSRK